MTLVIMLFIQVYLLTFELINSPQLSPLSEWLDRARGIEKAGAKLWKLISDEEKQFDRIINR